MAQSEPEELGWIQSLATALIQYSPEHFRSVYCVITEAPHHGRGRLHYQIGCEDFPAESTNQPSPEIHEAAFALYRLWTKDGQPFPGAKLIVSQQSDDNWKIKFQQLDDMQQRHTTDEEEERLWQEVYNAREEFYKTHFGPFPNDIQKLMNLSGVWPGGGIFQLQASRIKKGVCTSFGLTNPDMPTPVQVLQHERTEHEGNPQFSSTIQGRTPRWNSPDLAGYGYEVLVITPSEESWPLLPLSWLIQMEILNDVDLLNRVQEMEGVTIESLKIGDGSRTADFLIEPAQSPYPAHMQLPNGMAHLLIATWITRAEMNFAMSAGRAPLLAKLIEAGVGQISILDRDSVVG